MRPLPLASRRQRGRPRLALSQQRRAAVLTLPARSVRFRLNPPTLLLPGAFPRALCSRLPSFAGAVPEAVAQPQDPARMFIEIIPDNPIGAMANGATLSVIFFAILVGAGVIAAGAIRSRDLC